MTVIPDESPYVGLRPFESGDAPRFAGRTAATHGLLADWLTHRLVVLYGRHGTGKTSLLLAGAAPGIGATEADLLPIVRFSPDLGNTVADEKSAAVDPYLSHILSTWFPDPDQRSQVVGAPLADLARRHPDRAVPHSRSRPLLMAVDQFESVLTPGSPRLRALRDSFLEALGELVAAVPNLHLLVALRHDSLPDLAPFEDMLAAGSSVARVRLGALQREGATAALREPLRTVRWPLAADEADLVIDDLCTCVVTDTAGTSSLLTTNVVEPAFVQIVGSALWETVRSTAGDSRDTPVDGLVGGALSRHVTQALLDLSRQHGVDETDLRDWLVDTFVTERGRRRFADEGLNRTNGMPNALVHALERKHVLASEWRADSRWFRLSHDRLVGVLQSNESANGLLGGSRSASATELLDAARARFDDGDLDLAGVHAAEAVRRSTGRPRALADAEQLRGDISSRSGRPDDAEAHYREAAAVYESLQDHHAAGRVLTKIGHMLLERGLHGRAVEEFEAAATRLPGDAGVQADLARALWYSGQPWAAAAVFSSALMIAPGSADALADRGQLRLELGDDSSALDDLDGSTRLAPEIGATPEVRAARGLALARLGQFTEASTETDAALEIAPDNGTVLLWAAGVALASGDSGGAHDMLRRSLRARAPALLPHQVVEAMRQLRKPGAMA